MAALVQDLRYAFRTFAHGIGAKTAIFSLLDAVLLRPLPFPQADRIVSLGETGTGEDGR